MTKATHTVLVLGGYGFFGQRICKGLAKHSNIRLLIAGRRLDQSQSATALLGLPAENAIQLDANDTELSSKLVGLNVDTLIHTAGPFQNQDYKVAQAAIGAKCNYIDLADSREFVVNIEQLHQAACDANISVISGASSVPALSSAVIDAFLPLFSRLDSIRFGIASGGKVPGMATMQGVFSYCGKPIHRWEGGMWATTHGWLDIHRQRFVSPVGKRWMGSCDIPDLVLLPKRYPTAKTIVFHAGFASGIGHLTVWLLSMLAKAKVIKNVASFASLLNRVAKWMEPIVSDQGAMFVTLEGESVEGNSIKETWTLVARQNHGPNIPCGAAIALAIKLANGEVLPKGAMPCVGLLTVDEYLAPLKELDLKVVLS